MTHYLTVYIIIKLKRACHVMEHLRMVWTLALVPHSFTMWFMDILVTKACRHNYQNYMINIWHVLMSCGKVIFIRVDKCLVQYYDFKHWWRIWCEKKDKQPLILLSSSRFWNVYMKFYSKLHLCTCDVF